MAGLSHQKITLPTYFFSVMSYPATPLLLRNEHIGVSVTTNTTIYFSLKIRPLATFIINETQWSDRWGVD